MTRITIPYTKPFLPDQAQFNHYVEGIFERGWLTNNGVLLRELTERLKERLGVAHLLVVANGTLALQVAWHALLGTPHRGERAITTAFSFAATSGALQWEGVTPVFADIDRHSLCLDPGQVRAAMAPDIRAVMPVHVFGNACDVEGFEALSQETGTKLIYDASHCFGSDFKGESLLKQGDASTLSFHATKLFHTVEGGAIIFRTAEALERARQMINFGITGESQISRPGINAKMSEFHAAMGLCVLDQFDLILQARQAITETYRRELADVVELPRWHPDVTFNHGYFPILLPDEARLLKVEAALISAGIKARRYFYPSLHNLPFIPDPVSLPVTEEITPRILCLPIYVGLSTKQIKEVSDTIKTALR